MATTRIAARLALAALVISATNAGAEIVDIRWDPQGRFAHRTEIAAGKFVELCGKLSAGQQVHWRFDAGAVLDFNVHYHVGKNVEYPTKLAAVARANETLAVKIDQDYCWMWSNKSAAPVSMGAELQRAAR